MVCVVCCVLPRSRPLRVCVCKALPAEKINIRGHLIVLQHPHELKKALATVPLLRHCIEQASVVVGRRLKASVVP